MCIIIVAEDDKNIRINLIHFLIDEGFKVFGAENGIEAFNKALNIQPDLILSDINMPFVNGIELLRKLKNNSHTESIPLVFMTAEVDFQKISLGMSLGASGYITKPFNLCDLLDKINFNCKKTNKNRLNKNIN